MRSSARLPNRWEFVPIFPSVPARDRHDIPYSLRPSFRILSFTRGTGAEQRSAIKRNAQFHCAPARRGHSNVVEEKPTVRKLLTVATCLLGRASGWLCF
jgi:hypothetical protein